MKMLITALAGRRARTNITIATFVALASSYGWAQIYESEDAEGNPVFTDAPVNADSSTVELKETNIADAPPPTSEVTPSPSAEPGEGSSDSKPDDFQDPNQTAWDERQRRLEEEEVQRHSSTRHEVQDAEPRHEVQDAEPRHKVKDADPRHEVRDAESRHVVKDAEPRREVGD